MLPKIKEECMSFDSFSDLPSNPLLLVTQKQKQGEVEGIIGH
jgi:hypothetical protein